MDVDTDNPQEGSTNFPSSADLNNNHNNSLYNAPSTLGISPDIFTDTSPSRQQKLLHSRNARFPAKKLSISGLSSKLTTLIGNHEEEAGRAEPARNQENKLHKSKSTGTISRRAGLGILEEISNSTKGRAARKAGDILIYQDNPERPLLQSSPAVPSSPAAFFDGFTSPLAVPDGSDNMQLRDFSLNRIRSPGGPSPSSMKAKSRKRSLQTQFDADEYIEHIEKELQQARDEAYSPLTRRPMKEKLRAAYKENDRLQGELTLLKERFETEVKKTVEHKTAAEFELRRKVRDLEETIEEKDHLLRELQYQHEEKRLDTNIIETLKASIERLEQDKLDMEEINLSMNKRNEVLTQLLAMSPSKTTSGFNLASPTREKRNVRPMSLILPRQTSPPEVMPANPESLACSPLALSSSNISPLKLSSDQDTPNLVNADHSDSYRLPKADVRDTEASAALRSPIPSDSSRRWTMYSDISATSHLATDEIRPTNRRKARKFVAGSTQLKPLLLPTLNGDGASIPSTSTASSPRCWPSDPVFEADPEDTLLAHDLRDQYSRNSERESGGASEPGPVCLSEEGVRAYPHPTVVASRVKNTEGFDDLSSPSIAIATSPAGRKRKHASCYSLQGMPMPATPDSLVPRPKSLFSPLSQSLGSYGRTQSPEPFPASASPGELRNLRKRRKPSFGVVDSSAPVAKAPRRQLQRLLDRSQSPPVPLSCISPQQHTGYHAPRLHRQLRTIRSHDNFVEVLKQRDFALKPLAAITIKTVYRILATCTGAIRDLRRDPFALARRMLANAWHMHWRMLGQVSWWVLGLFIQPHSSPKARPPIDWDQYDGESIASRYCSSLSDSIGFENEEEWHKHDIQKPTNDDEDHAPEHNAHHPADQHEKPGWARSLLLWGKFSAALVLAVGGAVVNGPGDMLSDIQPANASSRKSRHRACQSCGVGTTPMHRQRAKHRYGRSEVATSSPGGPGNSFPELRTAFDFRSDTQLDSSSFLAQIQYTDRDLTLRPHRSPRRQIPYHINDPDVPSNSDDYLDSLP